MRKFRAEKFINRYYFDVALKYYPEIGEEALGRCKQSLIRGEGLCMGEWRFLQILRRLSGVNDKAAKVFDEFLMDAKVNLIRTQITEEEAAYWRNILSYKKSKG